MCWANNQTALLGPCMIWQSRLWRSSLCLLEELDLLDKHIAKLSRQTAPPRIAIPKAEKAVIESAIETAVKEGGLWLTLQN
jgi:hypothetical protein